MLLVPGKQTRLTAALQKPSFCSFSLLAVYGQQLGASSLLPNLMGLLLRKT